MFLAKAVEVASRQLPCYLGAHHTGQSITVKDAIDYVEEQQPA
jgi:hypothetical protein